MATIENGGVNCVAQAEISPLHLENLHRDLAIMRDVVRSAGNSAFSQRYEGRRHFTPVACRATARGSGEATGKRRGATTKKR
jgi:hypothetical protein